jgi:hypothetical protein
MEAFTLGVVTAFYDNVIVLQALLITTGIFLGLTLFTLQSKVGYQSSVLRCMFDHVRFSMTSRAWVHGYSVAFSPWVSLSPMLLWTLDLIVLSDDWLRRSFYPIQLDAKSHILPCGHTSVQWIRRLRHVPHQQPPLPRRIHHGGN